MEEERGKEDNQTQGGEKVSKKGTLIFSLPHRSPTPLARKTE